MRDTFAAKNVVLEMIKNPSDCFSEKKEAAVFSEREEVWRGEGGEGNFVLELIYFYLFIYFILYFFGFFYLQLTFEEYAQKMEEEKKKKRKEMKRLAGTGGQARKGTMKKIAGGGHHYEPKKYLMQFNVLSATRISSPSPPSSLPSSTSTPSSLSVRGSGARMSGRPSSSSSSSAPSFADDRMNVMLKVVICFVICFYLFICCVGRKFLFLFLLLLFSFYLIFPFSSLSTKKKQKKWEKKGDISKSGSTSAVLPTITSGQSHYHAQFITSEMSDAVVGGKKGEGMKDEAFVNRMKVWFGVLFLFILYCLIKIFYIISFYLFPPKTGDIF